MCEFKKNEIHCYSGQHHPSSRPHDPSQNPQEIIFYQNNFINILVLIL